MTSSRSAATAKRIRRNERDSYPEPNKALLGVLRIKQARVVEVVDWSRPDLFEAFGLPMSFPPSHRSNL
jgi:hypothetical protein